MIDRGRQIAYLTAALMTLAFALWLIVPAFAERGDYGVNTGASQSTPGRLEPTSTRMPPPSTDTPPPPTDTPVPPTPVPPTPTQDPNCKQGYYLQHAPDGSSGNCVPIPG